MASVVIIGQDKVITIIAVKVLVTTNNQSNQFTAGLLGRASTAACYLPSPVFRTGLIDCLRWECRLIYRLH